MTGQAFRVLIVAALAIAMLPATALAQAPSAGIDPAAFRRALSEADLSNVEASAPLVPRRSLSRGAKIGIGAGIGAAVGLTVGCPMFGETMDIPHGVDMLMGAGIFATVGALIGRGIANKTSTGPAPSPRKTVGIAPILSKSTKGVMVRLSLK